MDFMVFDFDAVVYFDSFPSVLFLRQVVYCQGLDSRGEGRVRGGVATPNPFRTPKLRFVVLGFVVSFEFRGWVTESPLTP